MNSPVAQRQLSRCGDGLDLDEEVVEDLFEFTRYDIYGDHKNADSLRQQCLRASYLAYIVRHPYLKHHPSPIGHDWELVDGRCRPIHHTQPALPKYLLTPSPLKQVRKMRVNMMMGKMMMYKERRGTHQKMMIKNALIRTDHVSQCHNDLQHNTKRKMVPFHVV
ncbi:hypothetical protein SK128_012206 [Halocaridina rubra]|uniref:Uncharacterized protein n=1 Tax=Halocaridina rubra TaxID=373956 RepID=A0AAN8XUL9_HALRR